MILGYKHQNTKDSASSSSKTQTTLALVVTYSDKTKAEILMAFKSITTNYSNNSCFGNDSRFHNMLLDSNLA